MQLIEVSEVGVRASIVRMVSNRAKLQWLLFPMVHLGSREYYAEVERRTAECDLLLVEGVDSRIVDAITASYRLAANSGEDTVVQGRLGQSMRPDQVIPTDISGSEFDEAWGQIPLKLRIGLPLIAPLYGLWLRHLAQPLEFHSHMNTDDLPASETLMAEEMFPQVFDLLVHRRDAHLHEQIDAIQERLGDENNLVGVAWGAAHIGAVVHHLGDRWHYFPRSAEWITVFDYTGGAWEQKSG